MLVEVRGWYPHTHSSPLTLMGMRCRGGEVWAGLWSLWIWVIVSLELSHSLVYDLVLEGTALPTTAARGSLLGSMQMLMPKMPSEMPPGPSAYRVHEIRVLTQVPFPESPVGPQRCLWLVPWFPGASLGWFTWWGTDLRSSPEENRLTLSRDPGENHHNKIKRSPTPSPALLECLVPPPTPQTTGGPVGSRPRALSGPAGSLARGVCPKQAERPKTPLNEGRQLFTPTVDVHVPWQCPGSPPPLRHGLGSLF